METPSLTQLGRIVDFGAVRVDETRDLDDAKTLLEAIESALANLRTQIELVRAAI